MSVEQTIIQVRIDKGLKDQVTEVFDKIGIDIPTAVRMFFKAVIREQRLPFSTRLTKDVVTLEMTAAETEKLMKKLQGILESKRPMDV